MSPRACLSAVVLSSLLIASLALAQSAPELETFKSRNYIVHTNLDPREARDYVQHMDAVYAEFTRRFSAFNKRNNTKSNLYLFAEQEDYLLGLAERGINATNSGGMFFRLHNGEEGLATWIRGKDTSRLWHVLQHEGLHQFAHLRLGDDLPPWVDEGVAEYFGHALLIRGKLRLGLVPEGRLLSVVEAIKEEEHLPFEELILMTYPEWNARVSRGHPQSSLQYAQSWAIAHFLVHADNGKYEKAFNKYLKLLAAGRQNDQAFELAFGSSNLDPFEDAWIEFMLELEPDPISAATERLEFMAEGLRELGIESYAVTSIDDLRRKLRAIEFEVTTYEHGMKRTITSEEDHLFVAPPSDIKRKTSELVLTPDPEGALPPSLEVTGLRVPVRLEWTRDDEDRLSYEITYK